jgi:hypothetical protein
MIPIIAACQLVSGAIEATALQCTTFPPTLIHHNIARRPDQSAWRPARAAATAIAGGRLVIEMVSVQWATRLGERKWTTSPGKHNGHVSNEDAEYISRDYGHHAM